MAIYTSSQNGLLIAVIVGVVMIAMFKSKRPQSGRVGPGWWVGLVILLICLSGAFTFKMWSRGGHENRTATVSPLEIGLQEAHQEIQAAAQQVKDSLHQAQEQMKELGKRENRGSKTKVISHTPQPPAPPTTRDTQYLPVSDPTPGRDEKRVRKTVIEKAVKAVDEWVAGQLPTKSYYVWNRLDQETLRLSPDDVKVESEQVKLPDGEEQTLFTGSYKVELTPKMQEDLLAPAWTDIERGLAEETFVTQGVFFIVIAGITIFLTLLGLYRYYVWWSRNKLAALQAIPSH
jgi:hypothetical protein